MVEVSALTDPAARARTAHEWVTATDEALKIVSAVRKAAVAELRGEGWSWQQIGDLLGIHRNRAAHLLDP